MTVEISLGQLMLDIDGLELSAEDRELLVHPKVGGVILFSRNYKHREQLTALCQEIHALRSPRLLIAVDQEGGRVQRFRDDFLALPPAKAYGALYDTNPRQAMYVCEQAGWLMAAELVECGVDFSFAPVVDLDHGVSDVIGDRAFHHTVDGVVDLARAWVRGMHRAGMAVVMKHFPGHGAIVEDSHVAIPVDARPLKEIAAQDMLIFERMVLSGVEGVMPAHVYYPALDAKYPASFSRKWLDLLRQQFRFTGAIFSDDISMEGASKIGDYGKRATRALTAGCDMVVVCNHREGAIAALNSLSRRKNDAVSDLRFVRFHAQKRPTLTRVARLPRYKDTVKLLQKLEYNDQPQLQV
jgi:beta-N-acetylhexosaminidase